MIALSCRVLALVSSVFGTSSIEIRAAIDLGHQSIAFMNTVARRFNSAINAGSRWFSMQTACANRRIMHTSDDYNIVCANGKYVKSEPFGTVVTSSITRQQPHWQSHLKRLVSTINQHCPSIRDLIGQTRSAVPEPMAAELSYVI